MTGVVSGRLVALLQVTDATRAEKMEFDRAPRADSRFTAQTERIRRELATSGIAFVGLAAGTRPADGRFAGLERFNDTVTNVRIVYERREPGAPWAAVDTARWAGTPVSSGPLRDVLEHHMRLRGDRFSAVEWSESHATVLVDGQPVPGRIVRAGAHWWAARCAPHDLEISVVARDWRPDTIAVDTVTDPVPMLDRLALRPHPDRHATPEPVPADLSGEPHRALVDAALAITARRAGWLVDGGPPPELPRYWSTLWQAAVERHTALTGAPEPAARTGVGSIVNQLTSLHDRADWFRDNARLRERAIAETLLYGTQISDQVASRPAQLAWQRQQAIARPARRGGDAGRGGDLAGPNPSDFDGTDAQTLLEADQRWLAAWAAWAHQQS